MQREGGHDFSADAIAKMDTTQLMESLVDVFDFDLVTRSLTIAMMKVRAKELGVADIFRDLLKEYGVIDKKASAEYAREMSRQSVSIELDRGSDGKVLTTSENFFRILRADPMFSGVKYSLLRAAPEIEENGVTRSWEDADDADARRYIENSYRIHNDAKYKDALMGLCRTRSYHPIRDIIDAIEWDGKDRIHTFLHRWMKCEDTLYTREVSRLIFAGGVHRVYDPGCKFDDMPVLIGTKQGEGKSTLVRWLAMEDRFFREVTIFEGQASMEILDGAWICEVGELLAMTRTREQEAIKSYLTRQIDVYRRSYGHRISSVPRQCIFIGTTNKEQFLVDKTGGRRFYPVKVQSRGYELFDYKEEIQAEILQCWAEARNKIQTDFMRPFADRGLSGCIQEAQEAAQEDDYRVGLILEYLKDKNEVCGIELWEKALNNPYNKPTPKDSQEIGTIMQGVDSWVKGGRKRFDKYGQQRAWKRREVQIGQEAFLDVSDIDQSQCDLFG